MPIYREVILIPKKGSDFWSNPLIYLVAGTGLEPEPVLSYAKESSGYEPFQRENCKCLNIVFLQ